jgi:hypothetical protein
MPLAPPVPQPRTAICELRMQGSRKFAVAEEDATGILDPTGVGSVREAVGGEGYWIT